MENQDVYSYIKQQESSWRTTRVPLTRSKDWNMSEHIERCKAVANAWFYQGSNDINSGRPYDDIVTPIINVAFRSEGFDVKDIVPFVDNMDKNWMSMLIRKYHPQWARKNELDTFIDDVVETSIIYDLVLVKNVNNVRPEVVDLDTIAFCDQQDVLSAPLCLKHKYTPGELVSFKGKWIDEAIDLAITLAVSETSVSTAGDQKAKTPGRYIEVYELRGVLPDSWKKGGGEKGKYIAQMKIVCYYKDKEGNDQGLTLYEGIDKPLSENFKALKIDRIRSKGRACGRSIVESLFEPQVWNNYSAIKIKKLLDSALNVFITDDEELGNQKLSELKTNTILKQAKGSNTQMLNAPLQNLPSFIAHQQKLTNDARVIGSASEGSLGTNPASGTPFALENLVVQQGQGLHEFRQGKIATFFSDVLYRDWILQYLVDDMNDGKSFSEVLSLDEMQEVATQIATNRVNTKMAELIFNGQVITEEQKNQALEFYRKEFMKGGKRGFFKVVKEELKDLPISVYTDVKGKQKDLAKQADSITNLVREVLKNPQGFSQVPGIGKAVNEIIESSNLSPIDFTQITQPQTINQPATMAQPTMTGQGQQNG